MSKVEKKVEKKTRPRRVKGDRSPKSPKRPVKS